MEIKDELKKSILERMGDTASNSFLGRAQSVIDAAAPDREGLMAAAEKVYKMISLFFDKKLAQDMLDTLKGKIESGV